MTDSVLLNHRLGTGNQLREMLAGLSRLYGTLGKDFLQGPCLSKQRYTAKPGFSQPVPHLFL